MLNNVLRASSPFMICCTFSNPRGLSAEATEAMAAERGAGVISLSLMPPGNGNNRQVGPARTLLVIIKGRRGRVAAAAHQALKET